MAIGEIVSYETDKKLTDFIVDLEASLNKRGFIIHNKDHMALMDTYNASNIEMPEGFDLHMLQLCKPEKSSETLKANIERVALLPKFINVFTKNGKTQVRMLRYDQQAASMLLEDEKFGASMNEAFGSIIQFIEEAL